MKVLLYCTKATPMLGYSKGNGFGTDLGEYCLATFRERHWIDVILNGKVVASFELNKVDLIKNYGSSFRIDDEAYTNFIARQSCLRFDDLKKYLGNKDGYAWHIGNLNVFDEPVELGELVSYNELKRVMHPTDNDLDTTLLRLEAFNGNLKGYFLTKAPQSYQYVYYKGEKCLLLSVKSEWVYKILNGEKTIEIRKTLPKEVKEK